MEGGPLLVFQCPECEATFELSAVVSSPAVLTKLRMVGCPECGFAEVPADGCRMVNPPIDFRVKRFFGRSHPARWEVVAFQEEENRDFLPDEKANGKADGDAEHRDNRDNNGACATLACKRVVGLPGETIEIIGGDIWVNGEIVRKEKALSVPLSQMEPIMAKDRIALVHQTPVPWLWEDKTDLFQPKKIDAPILNSPRYPRLEPIPSDRLENVRDFSIRFRLRLPPPDSHTPPSAPLRLLANQGDRFWMVTLGLDGPFAMIVQAENQNLSNDCNQEFLHWRPKDFPTASRRGTNITLDHSAKKRGSVLVECDFRDRCATVKIDGKTVLRVPDQGNPETWRNCKNRPITTPFAFLLPDKTLSNAIPPETLGRAERNRLLEDALNIEFAEELSVERDIHYSSAGKNNGENREKNAATVSFSVPAGEYFLLGDNSAVSIDSRNWQKPTVPASRIQKIFRDR